MPRLSRLHGGMRSAGGCCGTGAGRFGVAIWRLIRAALEADRIKLQIEKLNRNRFGPRSERTARLLNQMELQLEELQAAATEDELAAEIAAAKTTSVAAFTRVRPARRPFPEHLPRERVGADCISC